MAMPGGPYGKLAPSKTHKKKARRRAGLLYFEKKEMRFFRIKHTYRLTTIRRTRRLPATTTGTLHTCGRYVGILHYIFRPFVRSGGAYLNAVKPDAAGMAHEESPGR